VKLCAEPDFEMQVGSIGCASVPKRADRIADVDILTDADRDGVEVGVERNHARSNRPVDLDAIGEDVLDQDVIAEARKVSGLENRSVGYGVDRLAGVIAGLHVPVLAQVVRGIGFVVVAEVLARIDVPAVTVVRFCECSVSERVAESPGYVAHRSPRRLRDRGYRPLTFVAQLIGE